MSSQTVVMIENTQISFSTFESHSILFRIYARDNRDGIFFFVECERHIILSSLYFQWLINNSIVVIVHIV